jgi:hypothetical protein
MMNKKTTTIDDKTALRAFVMPELFPFLLESYVKDGKGEEALREDIKRARECYKQIVASERQKVKTGGVKTVSA